LRQAPAAMAAIPMHMRADRHIIKRQQVEGVHERCMAAQVDNFKVEQKGVWENRMIGVIRGNKVKAKASQLEVQHRASLQDRRRELAEKLNAEQKAYEREMVEMEETPKQRMEVMAKRAYELKKRREDERKAHVQEKLYQQWRSGIDDLRTLDAQVTQLKTIADRDYQLDEKAAMRAEEKAHDEFYDRLWHEGYLAKIEREEREKELKRERTTQQVGTLGVQLQMKNQRVEEDKDVELQEADEMKKLWAMQTEEERVAAIREKVLAKVERKKADEYMVIQQEQKANEERVDKAMDKDFVERVLEKERKLTEAEEFEKTKAKKKALEFNNALKLEMARKAESEEELVRLQNEESEKQWQKRYDQWEIEELARRNLMEDVYGDRAEQVHMKHAQREAVKADLDKERDASKREVERLEAIDQERQEGEEMVHKRHQEELFRQMDFHQVQRHRQLQQHAIEQRQAAIAEEKIRRACDSEKKKAASIMQDVKAKRAEASMTRSGVTAPWDR